MFSLAGHLGKFVSEIESGMKASELIEWQAEYNIDPWGERRADLRSGIVASTVYNVNRGRGPSMKASEFMPDFEDKEPQTVAEMQARLLLATGARIHG